VAYLGDDATDEHAFRALKGRGLGIQVRDQQNRKDPEPPTDADVRMWAPTDLLPFLALWR
jgi:trehalose-6-phosphatase